MSASATQEKRAPFVMPPKPETVDLKIEDPLEWYEIRNVEFPNLPVQVSWDGGGPESKADKRHYVQNGKLKRWEFASGKIYLIPRSLADYLNSAKLTCPDPESEVDPKTGQLKMGDPNRRRNRYVCVLKRDYVPPAETKA